MNHFCHMKILLMLCLLLSASGCGRLPGAENTQQETAATLPGIAGNDLAGTDLTTQASVGSESECTETQSLPGTAAGETTPPETTLQPGTIDTPNTNSVQTGAGRVVVIDPGHQARGDSEQEPLGPGSDQMKKRVSSGTTGTVTGLPEYQLNLTIGLALRDELLARGYTVYMTRETHDVNISNMERALYASKVGGDILVRIHANGNDNPGICGALTVCQTKQNPYQKQYDNSRLLSEKVLDAYCAATGITKKHVWETDTMTGINWCSIPSTIVEMGYMSNADDDRKMSDPDMQRKMVLGIADGIDEYFAAR